MTDSRSTPRSLSAHYWTLLALLLAACGEPSRGPAIPKLGPLTELKAILRDEAQIAHRRLVAAPDELSRWVALGHVMDKCEVSAVSEAAWAGAAALDPANGEWPYHAGVAATDANRPAQAHQWFEACLRIDDGDRYAWRRLGSLALDEGDLPAARTAFEHVRDLAPKDHDGHTGLALVALNDGQAPVALEHATAALEWSPDDPYQRYLLGAALRASGELVRAGPHLQAGEGSTVRWAELPSERSVQFDREFGLMARGDKLAEEAKLEEAAAIYRRVLALRPEDGRVRSRLATVLAVMGRTDEGLALLDEALATTPDYYFVLRTKADVLGIAGRVPEARTAIEQAIEAWPQRAEAWIQLGALEAEAGRPGEAYRAFERACALAPGDPNAAAHLAQQMVSQGRMADAAHLLEETLPRIDAPPPYFLTLLLQSQTGSGRNAEELRVTRELIERAKGAESQGGGR